MSDMRSSGVIQHLGRPLAAVIRHSKHTAAGTITSTTRCGRFLWDARDSLTHNELATITKIGTDTLVTSLATEAELRFDRGEWSAFLAGAAAGEFDFTDQLAA